MIVDASRERAPTGRETGGAGAEFLKAVESGGRGGGELAAAGNRETSVREGDEESYVGFEIVGSR